MKKTLPILCLAVLAAGCSTPLFEKKSVVETVTVQPSDPSLPPETRTVTNTVVTVSPEATAWIATARGVNSTLNPTPTAPLVEIGLGALAAVLWFIAQRKSKQAAVVPTLVRSIENSSDEKLKSAVKKRAEADGVEKTLHQIVNQIT